MSFPIQGYSDLKFPSFNRPEIIGYFSLSFKPNSQHREYSEDLSQLKYYNIRESNKSVHFNLTVGINAVIRKPKNLNERIDNLLNWIINNYRLISSHPEPKKWLKQDFICYRGKLTNICTTPFDKRDGWIICAAKFHGNIYLCGFDNEREKQRQANLSKKEMHFMSWGYKFEQYVLSDTPTSTPYTKVPVNEAEEFNVVLTSKLGKNSILYSAEMDGICSKEIVKEPVQWKELKFIELKTTKIIRNNKQEDNYRKKLMRWWAQSFLVGIENIICGTRNEDGVVFNLSTLAISDIPKKSKGYWNACDCVNFCDKFLSHVKSVVEKNYNECIYKFEYKPGGDREVEMQMVSSTSEFAFLPDWYIEQVNKIVSRKI